MVNKETDQQLQDIQQGIDEVQSDVEVIDSRLVEERERVEQVIEYQQMTMRSAPLPSAEELDHYERIYPGMAKEILEMAKNQQNHDHKVSEKEQAARIELNNKVIDFETTVKSRDSKLGMISGIVIVLIAFSFSTYLAMNGKDLVASIIAGTTLVSIFTNLIINTRVKSNYPESENSKEGSSEKVDKRE